MSDLAHGAVILPGGYLMGQTARVMSGPLEGCVVRITEPHVLREEGESLEHYVEATVGGEAFVLPESILRPTCADEYRVRGIKRVTL